MWYRFRLWLNTAQTYFLCILNASSALLILLLTPLSSDPGLSLIRGQYNLSFCLLFWRWESARISQSIVLRNKQMFFYFEMHKYYNSELTLFHQNFSGKMKVFIYFPVLLFSSSWEVQFRTSPFLPPALCIIHFTYLEVIFELSYSLISSSHSKLKSWDHKYLSA